LLSQLAAVFATGNRAVIAATQAGLLPAGIPVEVRNAVGVVAVEELDRQPLALALLDDMQIPHYGPLLAAREGALVPIVDTAQSDAIPLWRLVAERAVCVNTTAAGGNASLMTLGS
jgi:RHH-type proline utilization regulon transcriptional repressor/proline dehydrogenase/delta 1-pyrroline-5-carboxylate dehydrogenase